MTDEVRYGEGYTPESIRRLFVVSSAFADVTRPRVGTAEPPRQADFFAF